VDEPEEVCAIIRKQYRDRVRETHPERRDKARKGV
jgi:hypothetical protein